MDNFTEILGVADSSTDEEIDRAYQKLASQHCPEQGGDSAEFQKIQFAYEQLLKSRNRDASHPAPTPLASKNSGRSSWERQLPLQDETTRFIFVNVLDIFMTYILMRQGAIEANPIANFFFQRFNFNGMIFFKMSIVLLVCLLAQAIAVRSRRKASVLLNFGSTLVGAVVIYSVWLFVTKFM